MIEEKELRYLQKDFLKAIQRFVDRNKKHGSLVYVTIMQVFLSITYAWFRSANREDFWAEGINEEVQAFLESVKPTT